MCGIAGMLGRSDRNLLREMLGTMRHRGPDDLGIHMDDHVAIGQTRLSIIDVSGGKQPIYNEEEDGFVVCNGEIYNYGTLKQKLPSHSFRTHSDTEIVLHLYEEIGPVCVESLDGMFAFAVKAADDILLARDPLGIKPLYYAVEDGEFYFASEIKALLKASSNVHEFPPGHYYTRRGGFTRFYTVPSFEGSIRDTQEAVRNTREMLRQAVEKRLMSDVPVGVYLSGGVDSSVVTAIASKSISDLNTFSVGVEGSRDLDYASKVAQYCNTQHYQYVYSEDDAIKSLREIIYCLESYDYALVRSAVPNFLVSGLAHGKAKVILTGEGADEVFSGYHYLKQLSPSELHQELWRITSSLHNLNLQRCDRMAMAHSIEARVPFLDINFLNMASQIPLQLKVGPDGIEKWVLRTAFKDFLPGFVTWRKKEKFSHGAGSAFYLKTYAEKQISDQEFQKAADQYPRVRSKEELLYLRIFKEFYPESLVNDVALTLDVEML